MQSRDEGADDGNAIRLKADRRVSVAILGCLKELFMRRRSPAGLVGDSVATRRVVMRVDRAKSGRSGDEMAKKSWTNNVHAGK